MQGQFEYDPRQLINQKGGSGQQNGAIPPPNNPAVGLKLSSADLKNSEQNSDEDDDQPGKFHYSQLMKGGQGQESNNAKRISDKQQPMAPIPLAVQPHQPLQVNFAPAPPNINSNHLLLQQQMAQIQQMQGGQPLVGQMMLNNQGHNDGLARQAQLQIQGLAENPSKKSVKNNPGNLTEAQIQRKKDMEENEKMLEECKKNFDNAIKMKLEEINKDVGQVNSKLLCIRFNIDRKFIKNEAREVRRQSIHKLEIEKNLVFRPKKDRSKSIPTINMNLRLKALKHMKEDLLLRRSKIKDEISKDDYELLIRIQPYCYNDIKREIMIEPEIQEVKVPVLKKRLQNYEGNGNESSQSEHEVKVPALGVIQENNSRNSKQSSEQNPDEEKKDSNGLGQMEAIQEEEKQLESCAPDGESEKHPNQNEQEKLASSKYQPKQVSVPIIEEDQVQLKQVVCRKYITNYDIDLSALPDNNSSHQFAGLQNRNMSVQIGNISLGNPGGNPGGKSNIEAKEQIQMMMKKQDQFIENLGKLGVNMQQVKNHLRSNSVGGISSLDHQKILQMIQENMNKNNKAPAIVDLKPENQFLNLENNGILPNEELNIDLIPLNILTREQFIDLIKSIVGNKILLIQLKQINQLDQQIKAITGEIEYDHGSQKFWINEQIGIINEYIINSDQGWQTTQNERNVHLKLNLIMKKVNNQEEEELYFNLNQIQFQLQKQLEEVNNPNYKRPEEQKQPNEEGKARQQKSSFSKNYGIGQAASPLQPQNSDQANSNGPSVFNPAGGIKQQSSFKDYKIAEIPVHKQNNQQVSSKNAQPKQSRGNKQMMQNSHAGAFNDPNQIQVQLGNNQPLHDSLPKIEQQKLPQQSAGSNKSGSVFQMGYSIKKVQY